MTVTNLDADARRLAEAWVAALDDEERRTLMSLAPARQESVRRRLGAVLAWHAAARRTRLPVEDFARIAGVGVWRFYSLEKSWEREPRLASLGAYAEEAIRRRPGSLGENARREAERTVANALRSDPDVRTSTLLAAVAALGLERTPSKTTLLRMIAAARARRLLLKGIGTVTVAIDTASVALLDGDGAFWPAALMIDVETTRILGVALPRGKAMFRAIAADALNAFRGEGVTLKGDAELRLEVGFTEPVNTPELLRLVGTAASVLGEKNVGLVTEGSLVRDVLGGWLGPLRIGDPVAIMAERASVIARRSGTRLPGGSSVEAVVGEEPEASGRVVGRGGIADAKRGLLHFPVVDRDGAERLVRKAASEHNAALRLADGHSLETLPASLSALLEPLAKSEFLRQSGPGGPDRA